MTNDEVKLHELFHKALDLLTEHRPLWEARYPKLLRDYQALHTALNQLPEHGTDARARARLHVLGAAYPVLSGIKALYLDGNHPGLARLAGLRHESFALQHDAELIDSLEELHFRSIGLGTELEEELVYNAAIGLLKAAIGEYKKSLSHAPPAAFSSNLAEAQQALVRLDVRMPNLGAWLPDLVAEYFRLRHLMEEAPDASSAALA